MEYISCCGIKCKECPIYVATEKNDDAMRIKLAKDYSTEQCAFTKDDMNCKGCHSEIDEDSKMCGNCDVRKCAHGKDILTCAECKSYPCNLIDKYVPVESENRKTLNQIYQNKS